MCKNSSHVSINESCKYEMCVKNVKINSSEQINESI